MYVNESGEWVLGGLEVLTTVGSHDPMISRYGGLVPTSGRYSPPEIARSGWGNVENLPVHAVDSWQLGVLIYEIFNGVLSNPVNEMGVRRKVPANLWSAQRSLCNTNAKQRLTSERFLSSPALKSDLVSISAKLHGLSIAEEYVFHEFLEKLKEVEDKFPRVFLHTKVLPELITCLDHDKGGTQTLTCIIQISKDMEPEMYKSKVLPVMLKMFGNSNRAVRMELVQSLPEYIEYLDKRVVSDKIYPALATGFTDTEPAIREQTVKAVLSIAPKLYDRQLNGDLLRQLAKTQNDAEQEIRANTTILLGKIAPLFSQNTRVSVLVTAFGRALKDPFVPSRLAALMGLASTAEYFGPQETCGRILGTVAPALIDKDKAVRNEATKTMGIFMGKVQEHIASLEKEEESGDTEETPNGWGGWTATIAAGLSKKIAASGTPSNGVDSAASSAAVSRTVTPSRFEVPVRSKPDPMPVMADDGGWGVNNGDLWDQDGDIDFDDHDELDEEPKPEPKPEPVRVAAAPRSLQVKKTPLPSKRPTFGSTIAHVESSSTSGISGSMSRGTVGRKTAPRAEQRPVRQVPKKVEKVEVDTEDGWGDAWGEI